MKTYIYPETEIQTLGLQHIILNSPANGSVGGEYEYPWEGEGGDVG